MADRPEFPGPTTDSPTTSRNTLLFVTFDGLAAAAEIDIEFGVLFDTHPDHRNMVVIQNDWKSSTFDQEGNVVLSFSPGNTKQTLDLTESPCGAVSRAWSPSASTTSSKASITFSSFWRCCYRRSSIGATGPGSR